MVRLFVQFCGKPVRPSIQFAAGAGGTAPMNVTTSKKPSFGGCAGASWPPASDATDGGWKSGAPWFEQAAVDNPGSTFALTFGKRPLLTYAATLEWSAVPEFQPTPDPRCVAPL